MLTISDTRTFDTQIVTTDTETTFTILERTGNQKVKKLAFTKAGHMILDDHLVKSDLNFAILYSWMKQGHLPNSPDFSITFNEEFLFKEPNKIPFGFDMNSYYNRPELGSDQLITPACLAERFIDWVRSCEENTVK